MEIISKSYLSLSKSVCQICGTINSADGPEDYSFNKNVYCLNSCDNNFFLDFDNTEYTPYNSTQHYANFKDGEYCAFCKGTYAQAVRTKEAHDFTKSVDGQLTNNRFYVAEVCKDCGYETSEYVVAKSVVTSYYGEVDGEAHTVEVADLSESDVTTRIRYGTEAGNCNRTSAPNFTTAGYHTVYYEIDYIYGGETMTENGVGYVWLLEEEENNVTVVVPQAHEHDYHYLETVRPSCDELGYDRFQCNGCGDLIKTNYVQASGHDYGEILIREASCKQNGVKLNLCRSCGDFYEESTPLADHTYDMHTHNATCKSVGYDEYICTLCGDNYINNIKPMIEHRYRQLVRYPKCEEEGYTNYICEMCNVSYVSDYTDALGHAWDEGRTVTASGCTSEGVIEYRCTNNFCSEKLIIATDAKGHTPGVEATCTEPQICNTCGTVLELPKGHSYEDTIVGASCTQSGYTKHNCENCDHSYIDNYTDVLPHNYDEEVTQPNCQTMGYTTYSCRDCDAEYVSNYTDKLDHEYVESITEPSCTEFGFSVFKCENCDETYTGNHTDKIPHVYSREVIEPSCKEHGYTIFKCDNCGGEYIGNYTEETEHSYEASVTEPGCKTLGYTTYTCCACGETYKSDYIDPKGHTPGEWIVDEAATIEHGGKKHIECEDCGEVLQSSNLAQLADKDNTDEDGKAQVGDYSLILLDENSRPIFNSEISIDVNDNVSVILTNGRLLDFNKPTKLIAFFKENQQPKKDLAVDFTDENGNKVTGITNNDGVLTVPNGKSGTGDDNGTIGNGDENKETYVVRITDKFNVTIPNCKVYIGESNNIVADLPDGTKPTRENPVIITVEDHNGNAQKGITIIALGDSDFIEKGKTDIYGKITLPTASDGFTNEEGRVNVNERNIVVSDENGVIPNAYVVYNEDGSISVNLPEGKDISHHNRVSVSVLDSVAKPIEGVCVTVKDVNEILYTGVTDNKGKVYVPPLSEDYTDADGKAKVNGINVFVSDESKVIEGAFVTIADNKISVKLPETVVFDYHNRITVTVTDSEEKPVKDMSVTVIDKTDREETNLTNELGKAVVPPINIDETDVNGYCELNEYGVTVKNETAPIENAFAEINENGEISVKLPEGISIAYDNRITVTVANKGDKTPVKDVKVTVIETVWENENEETVGSDSAESETADEPKSANGVTDRNGVVVFPALSEDFTDDKGDSSVTDKKEEAGTDSDGDGQIDEPGELTETKYVVTVSDTKGIITDAFVTVKDGKITVKLPESCILTTANQTTVTVKDSDGKPKSNVSVTINDKTDSKSGTTNSSGQVTLPVKQTSSSSPRPSYSGGGGGSSYSSTSVRITDKDGKSVNVTRTNGTNISTLTLPSGKNLSKDDNYYNITVTSSSKPKKGYVIVLKDRNGNEVRGATNEEGKLTLPSYEHTAYIKGYDDGTFKPEGNMTRAEAAAIFARLVAERKGESITGKAAFNDVPVNSWYNTYVGYLEKYNVINGYTDGTFKPESPVTRAEFTAMTVRFYDIFEDVEYSENTSKYKDVDNKYWAIKDISYASGNKWLNGYVDGTFKPDINITRAEVVTVVNRVIGCRADKEYINDNLEVLDRFTDVKSDTHWAFYDILSAANTIQCADCPHLD